MILSILVTTAIFAIAFYLRINQAKISRKLGETKVSPILKSLPNDYSSFNNMYLKHESIFVQIDYVIIPIYHWSEKIYWLNLWFKGIWKIDKNMFKFCPALFEQIFQGYGSREKCSMLPFKRRTILCLFRAYAFRQP